MSCNRYVTKEEMMICCKKEVLRALNTNKIFN